jgi:hypothetical protein
MKGFSIEDFDFAEYDKDNLINMISKIIENFTFLRDLVDSNINNI